MNQFLRFFFIFSVAIVLDLLKGFLKTLLQKYPGTKVNVVVIEEICWFSQIIKLLGAYCYAYPTNWEY